MPMRFRSCGIMRRSLTGAWIETPSPVGGDTHISRSLTGAWIETLDPTTAVLREQVAPLRGRGLKHPARMQGDLLSRSLPYGGVD